MDPKLIYVKTPTGDEAIRQSAHVVKRELRMVLVQVDGKVTVEQLSAKLGNRAMVENALADLEDRGLIALSDEAVAVWEHSKMQADEFAAASSRFSGFVPKSTMPFESGGASDAASRFSILRAPLAPRVQRFEVEPEVMPDPPSGQTRSIYTKVFGGFAVLLASLLVLFFIFPYERFKPDVEAVMGLVVQDKVSIERIGVALWPRPQLVLGSVTVGGSGDFRIDEARIESPLSLLSGSRTISGIKLSGVSIDANKIVSLPMFAVASSQIPGARIARVSVNQLQVTARDLSINDLAGDIFFKPDGHVEKASFHTVDRSISLEASPADQGVFLNIEGAALKVPGTAFGFDSVQARGMLQKDRLVIQSMDGFLLGGTFKGSWLLAWGGGLTTAGDGAFRLLDGRRITAAFVPSLKLEGDFSGNLAWRSRGDNWGALLNNTESTLDVDIRRGMFHGVDLGEAARRAPGSVVRAGATKFDRFLSVVTLTPGRIAARDLRLESGMMTAAGQFSAGKDRQVDGALTVTLQTSVSTLRIPLHVQGVLPELSVTNGK